MADDLPEAHKVEQGFDFRRNVHRRRLMLGVAILMSVVVFCVAAILIMLQRLEARSASFQPPMTALERQRLLPQDPVLDAAPQIDGLRYGRQPATGTNDSSPLEVRRASHGPLGQTLIIDRENLHAGAVGSLQQTRHLQ